MVLEITNENVYIGIIVVLAAIQIFQWRKVDMLERIMSQVIDDITHFFKIDVLVERVFKAFGKDCGCKRRRDKLNKIVPYKKKNNKL